MNAVEAALVTALVLLWGIPEAWALSFARQFPPSPHHRLECGGVSFFSCFRYPTIPLRDGIRHIHTPEHLENLTWPFAQRQRRGFFHIDTVDQPRRYGDRVSVRFRCSVNGRAGQQQTMYLLSSARTPAHCTYMCVRDGRQRALMELRASALGEAGHRLSIVCTYLIAPRAMDRDMEPVLRFLKFFERRMHAQKEGGQGTVLQQRANLMWYRRMALGLTGTDGSGLD